MGLSGSPGRPPAWGPEGPSTLGFAPANLGEPDLCSGAQRLGPGSPQRRSPTLNCHPPPQPWPQWEEGWEWLRARD